MRGPACSVHDAARPLRRGRMAGLMPDEAIDCPRHAALRIVSIPGKGRAVIAIEPINAGALIEASPVVPLAPGDRLAPGHPLHDYTFAWDDPPFDEAIAFGLASLLNHADRPNAGLRLDRGARLLSVVALAPIAAGDEVTIDYGIALWFEPA